MSKTNKKTIHRPLFWRMLLLSCFLLLPAAGTSNQIIKPKIVVLPFEVNAQRDLSYLQDQIATVLADHLERQGAVTTTVKIEDSPEALKMANSPAKLKKIADEYDADHIIWGSFSLIGNNFSLDVQLMTTKATVSSQSSTHRFFAQGQNLENLITVTNGLAEQIGLKLFQREIVADLRVQGNQRIEADAILRVIHTEKNKPYQPNILSEDIRAIFAMGYFDDVRVESQSGPTGKIVIFHVKEKPTVRRIKIKGNNYIDEEDIRGNLTINTGAILNLFKIRSNMEQIETLYKEKNYHKVHVDYKINPLANNQADLEFIIEEGPKIYVTQIRFEGNRAFSTKLLKKKIEVSEKGFFYWLTDSGDLDRTELEQDVARLKEFYSNEGYINAHVGEPEVQITNQGIEIIFKIDEGKQYKVGRIDITGDLIGTKSELLNRIQIKQQTYYSRDAVRKDILALTDIYTDKGYAYADISPRIKEDEEKQIVDITFDAKKNEQVFFEKIIIKGNTRTRDKVIRRELKVHEQGLFSGKDLKRSIRNLYRLEYFEDIKVNTTKGSDADKMILELDITEKPTGSFSFGAGYSSEESAFFTGSISQHNFLGRGQTLDFNGTIGKRTQTYQLSFIEPHILDSRYWGRVKAYNQVKQDYNYVRSSRGGGFQFGLPVADYTRLSIGYNLDETEIEIDTETVSVEDEFDKDQDGNHTDMIEVEVDEDVPRSIEQMKGTNLTSSVDLSLTYDSRDRSFNTTEGSKHSLFLELAGVGGDIGYTKYIAQTQWFLPLYKSLIGFGNARIGFVHGNDPDKLFPDYEKFYLGGINSLRGFGYKGVYLTEIDEDDGDEIRVGGEQMIQFNLELIMPFVPEAGVNFVLFFDNGNIYTAEDKIRLDDLRTSAGAGIRWLSPIAPIRLEYGWVLDPKDDDETGDWEFTLGGSF